jgi:branched-chain amino acid aminotransferase
LGEYSILEELMKMNEGRSVEMKETIRMETGFESKSKPDPEQLGFGRFFSDHMFLMDYDAEKGWYDPRIVPYAPISLDPAAMVFHYGQAVFEGLKAFNTADGRILLFRPERNARRFNQSNDRLDMPQLDEEFFIDAIRALVKVDKDWIPQKRGSSLYIRPFIMATEPALGVRASSRYLFAIILSPVDSYYAEGLKPVHIHVEKNYVRAVRGGIGFAKTPANYASSLKAQALAKKEGSEQVLWLDGIEQTYIEEVGSMNVFFKVAGEVWTPALNGSILEGVTRNSVIRLLEEWQVPVHEKRISIGELVAAYENGTLEEAFGTGTAAVISPIGSLRWNGRKLPIGGEEIGGLSRKLYDTLTGIQYGEIEDTFEWTLSCE